MVIKTFELFVKLYPYFNLSAIFSCTQKICLRQKIRLSYFTYAVVRSDLEEDKYANRLDSGINNLIYVAIPHFLSTVLTRCILNLSLSRYQNANISILKGLRLGGAFATVSNNSADKVLMGPADVTAPHTL